MSYDPTDPVSSSRPWPQPSSTAGSAREKKIGQHNSLSRQGVWRDRNNASFPRSWYRHGIQNVGCFCSEVMVRLK